MKGEIDLNLVTKDEIIKDIKRWRLLPKQATKRIKRKFSHQKRQMLNARDMQIVKMYLLQYKTFREIGDELDISHQAVERLYIRAIKFIIAAIGDPS